MVLLLAWAARALQAPRRHHLRTCLKATQTNDEPATRKAVAAVAGIGTIETAYLTYSKLTGVQGLRKRLRERLEGPHAQLPGGVSSCGGCWRTQPFCSSLVDPENEEAAF